MEKANKAQQHVLVSQQAQRKAQQELDDISDIVRNVHEHAPDLKLQDGYIEHVLTGLIKARRKYEVAAVQQQNATSELLTAQAVTLEVMGETSTLSEPNGRLNFGRVKDKPCILCKWRYTTDENLHNHIVKEHGKFLYDFVSIKDTFYCNVNGFCCTTF